jgi:hypothetical protein
MDLTSEQLWYFRHNGFLKLPYQLLESDVAKLKETIVLPGNRVYKGNDRKR